MQFSRISSSIIAGVLGGVLLTLIFLYISFAYAIHDGFRMAAYLFPITVWLSPDIDSLTSGTILLALIQWPLYGLIIGLYYKNRKHSLWAAVVVCLIIQHLLLANVAAARVNALPVKFKLERDLAP